MSEGAQVLEGERLSDLPVCEAARKPVVDFMTGLSAPAQRALEGAGLTTLGKLAKHSEVGVLKLHGMGKASLPKLRAALKKTGKRFREI